MKSESFLLVKSPLCVTSLYGKNDVITSKGLQYRWVTNMEVQVVSSHGLTNIARACGVFVLCSPVNVSFFSRVNNFAAGTF